MSKSYEDALKRWGARKLEAQRESRWYPVIRGSEPDVNVKLVHVSFNFDEGNYCCGGMDPNCYCSLAEDPSAEVLITDGYYRVAIAPEDFDFARVLGEILEDK